MRLCAKAGDGAFHSVSGDLFAVLRTAGYAAPVSPIIGWTGLTTLLLAPFGGFAFNLAAITAAICTGPEAHSDAGRRYVAGLSCGIFYLLLGVGGGAVAALFAAFPVEFILALAGLHDFCLRRAVGHAGSTSLSRPRW